MVTRPEVSTPALAGDSRPNQFHHAAPDPRGGSNEAMPA
jgi:hypothetical protein